jgi:hypothetical protein
LTTTTRTRAISVIPFERATLPSASLSRSGSPSSRTASRYSAIFRHYPPDTSKWNKDRVSPVLPHHAERARPAAHGPCHDHQADCSDHDQLKAEAVLDTTVYEKGIKITKAEMKCRDIHGDAFHLEWNYTPRSKS